MTSPAPQLEEVDADGKLTLRFHRGQKRAWESKKRFVAVIAGAQSGKTVFGPHWLRREVETRGPGDYLVVTPTYPLLIKKALPAFLKLFDEQMGLGAFNSQQKVYAFSKAGQEALHGAAGDTPTKVFFGHAQDPDSLESATAKAAWLDEAGQKKFRLGSWEAVQRRLAIHRGRALITTTPYDLSWLKQKIHDPWQEAGRNHPEIDVVRFDSTENPAFSREEFERARRELPRWKFDLYFRGVFTKPAGQIYDCFDESRHVVAPFAIPPVWERHLGLDFGGANTAGVFIAAHPHTHQLYAYREYRAGARTAAEHAEKLLSGEPRPPEVSVGGSKSEGQWRREFALAGLPVVEPPVAEVEVGINRVYSLLATGRLVIFKTCEKLLDELQSYSRVLDERGDPTEAIEDKEFFHGADSLRYVCAWLAGDHASAWRPAAPREARSMVADAPAGVFLPEEDGGRGGW